MESSNLPSPIVYLPAYRYPTFSELAGKILKQMDDEYKASIKKLGELQEIYPTVREIIESEKLSYPVDLQATKHSIHCIIKLSVSDELDSLSPLIDKLKSIFPIVSYSPDNYAYSQAQVSVYFRKKTFDPIIFILCVQFPVEGLRDVKIMKTERTTTHTETSYRFMCARLNEMLGLGQ